MAIEQMAVQELPFTLEPLSPKRVQTWSRFAGRAATEADMWIVRTVYYAFWFEMRVHTTFGHVVQSNQSIHDQSDATLLVQWLDALAYEHLVLRDAYSEIADQIANCEASYARYYKDIDERFIVVLGVLDAIHQYGVSLCYAWGLAVPEHLLQAGTSPTVPAAGEGGERL